MSSFHSVPCFAIFLRIWIVFVFSFVWHSINLSISFCRNSEAATEGVLRNFEKLTGKHRCQSLFFSKVYFSFFLYVVNRDEGIWSSDNQCDVKLNLWRNEMLSSLTWKTLVRKNKQTKQASISFKSIIFVKKYILPLLYSNSKTLTKKKKSFLKFSVFEGTPRP